jgi:carboxypeptidase C (cathepsin A)
MKSVSSVFVSLCSAALLLPPIALRAQDETPTQKSAAPRETELVAADSTTQGTVDVGGQHIAYRAIAGTLTVGATDAEDAQVGPDGKPLPGTQLALSTAKDPTNAPPTARMSYVAYFKEGAKPDDRPITFVYNGGPGASAMFLHMGSLGPKYVETDGDKHLLGAPYKLVDNPYSLLDASDLVFIDMPGTGFGRLTGKDAGKAFWGVDQDADAFARFIIRFLTKYSRWNSPKFLFGESYGTTRSAVLANDLENRRNVDLNGVILLGEILDFPMGPGLGSGPPPGMDLPFELALPTYAATAWYHKKLSPKPPDLEAFLKQVEDFALGDYMHALAQGADLSAAEKQAIAEKIHEYTGLPVDYVIKANLRVTTGQFEKAFADDQGMTAGRSDTRFLGPSMDPLSEYASYDPQGAAIWSAYFSSLNIYFRNTLKYGTDETYLPAALFGDVRWDMSRQPRGPADAISTEGGLNVSADLASAIKANPHLKVMVNGGYYDLATPFFAAEYEEKHLPIPPSLAKNIEYDWYESGHMVYVRDECRQQLHDRVAAFIKSATAPGGDTRVVSGP